MDYPISDGVRRGVFAFLTAPATTTVVTAGTYYPIAGTFNNNPIENFSIGTVGIQYDGKGPKCFEIDWHTSLEGDHPGVTVTCGIRINGVVQTASLMTNFLKTLGERQALSGTDVVELNEGDEIELVLTADGNGDQITVDNFTTTISKFFKI